MLYSLIFKKIIHLKRWGGFSGGEKSRWLWGYLQILGPKNPWHRLRFHKPSQSCNLLAPSSGVSGGWFRWNFSPNRSKSGTQTQFSRSADVFFGFRGNYLRNMRKPPESLETDENLSTCFLVNTNIPHPKIQTGQVRMQPLGSNTWSMEGLGWYKNDTFDDLWWPRWRRRIRLSPTCSVIPSPWSWMQQWKVLHLLVVTLMSMNKNLKNDGFINGTWSFFLGQRVLHRADGCENVDGEKEQDCWILLDLCWFLIDSWTHYTKHIYGLE